MSNKVKYPRTPHLPWSPGLKDPEERLILSLDTLKSNDIVVTAKMDGENTTLYHDGLHARSLDYSSHSSRNLIKAFHSSIKHLIPPSFRIVVENLTATHSIHYKKLLSPFLGISVWDSDVCLSWADTLDYFALLGIYPVPTLYKGKYSELLLKTLYTNTLDGDELEGYVVRVAGQFLLKDFPVSIAKYVRENHVQTDQHWVNKPVVYNNWNLI